MRPGLRFALLGACAVPLLAWALLRLGFFTPLFNVVLTRELDGRVPLLVHVADLRGDIFHSLSADRLVVLAPGHGAEPPLVSVDHLDLEYRLWPTRGPTGWRWSPALLHLDGLKLSFSRGAGGVWNLAPLWKPSRAKKNAGGAFAFPPLLVEWDNATVAFSDVPRGFHAVLDQVRGHLDLSRPVQLSFALSGRTEGHFHRNLALRGGWNRADGSWSGRLSLDRVELARYLNYFLPVQGLRFIAGSASLEVRLDGKAGGGLRASGRALLADGALKLPGVRLPLDRIGGELVFDRSALRFRDAQAHFLGSEWSVSGAILDPERPRYDVTVDGPAVPLEALSRQVRGMDLLDLSGTASVRATLKGLVQAPQVNAWVQAPWLGMAGFELESVSASASLFHRRLDVRRLSGTLWGGELDGSAGLDLGTGGNLKADLSLSGGLLQLARWKGARPLPLAGLVQAQVKASGPLRSPDLHVDLGVDRLRLGFWELGNLTANAGFSTRGFQGGFSTDQGLFSGQVAYSKGTFHDTHAALKGVDLASTVRALAAGASPDEENPGLAGAQALWTRLSGRLDGQLAAVFTVEGPLHGPTVWARPVLTRARLRPWGSEQLSPDQAKSQWLALSLIGSLGARGGQVLLGRDARPFQVLLGPRKAGWELSALGSYPWKEVGAPGNLALSFDFDLGLLDSLGTLGRTKGRLTGALAASGRLRSPRLRGKVVLSNFSCAPAHYLAPVKAGAALLLFHGRTVELSQMRFKAPGAVGASGLLDLSNGLDGLKGAVEITTDAQGLRLQNWASLGSGSLALTPLRLQFEGEGQAPEVSGRVMLSQARVVYAGGGAQTSAPEDGGGQGGSFLSRHPLSLDLSVGLGSGVWYEKIQSKALSLDLSDPRKWFGDTLQSAAETLTQPDISLRLAPTQHDFHIRGTTPDLDLRGDLLIDRGRVTLVGNDFEISHDKGPALIRLEGRRADVSGTAEASLSYTRFNPISQRPQQRTVEVLARITPLGPSELKAAGLEKSFLNYQVRFDSDPPIIEGDPARQQTAVVNLVVLGDPVVDQGSGVDSGLLEAGSGSVSGGPAVDPGALAAAGVYGTLATGFARKELNALLGRFKILGSDWLDVVRVSPRIRYLAVGTQPLQVPEVAAGPQPLASASQSQYDIDWVFELGKSIGEKLYTSLSVLTFGEASRESVILYSESNQAVQSYGVRAGLEYQLSPYRSVDVYGNFGCDDDLNPVPYKSTQQAPNPSYLVQWRDTTPTGNYGTLLARRRRWDSLQETKP